MLKRAIVCLAIGVRVALAWGCAGHQAVALIAEKNLNPRALAQVHALLSENPVDGDLIRFCVDGRNDAMADASTWADDARRIEHTGSWHYIDVPRQEQAGDPMKWCAAVGPPDPAAHADRAGCVLTAIRYNRDVVADESKSGPDRAKALRYLIHFMGDVHMPLHASDNKDSGGNCTEVVLLDSETLSNLHSDWDSGILERRLGAEHLTPAAYAEELNREFAEKKTEWGSSIDRLGDWIWSSHRLANEYAYATTPAIPLEPESARMDCNAESLKVYKLGIRLGPDYVKRVTPVIDRQIAAAGFRLAAVLNEVWP